MMYHL